MATLKLPEAPEGIPCKFDKNWAGTCRKPTDNGWCDEHENLTCSSCGAKAVKSCDEEVGSFICGVSLCSNCAHTPDSSGKHATKEVCKEMYEAKKREREATAASRISETIRFDTELGVPLNLFEFLKGPQQGYELLPVYYLELKHGLMGFFPAIYSGTKQIVFAGDTGDIKVVWQHLPPRESLLRRFMGYVNKEHGIAYRVTDAVEEQERCKPQKLISSLEVEAIRERNDPKNPIVDWAFGLFGDTFLERERFLAEIDRVIPD